MRKTDAGEAQPPARRQRGRQPRRQTLPRGAQEAPPPLLPHPHFPQSREGSSWVQQLPESRASPPPNPLLYGQVGKLSLDKRQNRAAIFPKGRWECRSLHMAAQRVA